MSFGYLCAIGIAVIFMLYLDGDIGVMMLWFLVLMPLVSLLFTLLIRPRVEVTLSLPDSASKSAVILCKITLTKSTPLPLPFLRMNLRADAHFEPVNPEVDENAPPARSAKIRRVRLRPDTLPLCLSMGVKRVAEYEIPLRGRYCGAGEVALEDVVLSDFLAMFKLKLKINARGKVVITPQIPQMKANSTLFRSVTTEVAAADEESEAAPLFSASSMPGYEHRDYIPGDSLKRINWKLSAKRRHLMVRKDEPVALARLSVVLDFRRDNRELELAARLKAEEELTESALGFLALCARSGYPSELSYLNDAGAWRTLEVETPEAVAVEAVTLLRGGFRSGLTAPTPLPPQIATRGSAVLLYFTTDTDPANAEALSKYPVSLYLVIPREDSALFTVPKNGSLWHTTSDRRLVSASESFG